MFLQEASDIFVLERILLKAKATLNASRNSQKEKEVMKKEIEKRLDFLENETENVCIH